jgi:Methyltransferase domain
MRRERDQNDDFPPAMQQRQSLNDRAFTGSDIRADILGKYGFEGDLLDIYVTGSDQLVHKWHHYLPLYDRYFAAWRNRPLRFLEIGVFKGGSLSMWRKYFGPDAVLFGIDIDPACAAYDGIAGQVRIGSQDDPDFLRAVVGEMGGVDVVLDDGSHVMEHIRKSFEVLFPLVTSGGTYMVEDLHSAYWRRYGGGYRRAENFFNFVREMTDDLHEWYHDHGLRHEALSKHCTGIHVHDSICVFDRGERIAPTHSRVGG